MTKPFLIYGAYGYTGKLIARMAVERGMRPVLAGRNATQLRLLGLELGLDHRAFSLDDPTAMDEALRDYSLVLHCAGPFIHTAAPMAEACIRTQTDYLDITGEIAVFETLAMSKYSLRAFDARVMLMPGVGFDVVPTDCLALHLAERLPSATHLRLAFRGLGGGVSRGTAKSGIEHMHQGGWVRRNGKLTPAGVKSMMFDFGRGPKKAVRIPWGDVSTAWYSTEIPNIEVYSAGHAALLPLMRLAPLLKGIYKQRWFKDFMYRQIDKRFPPGPSAEMNQTGKSVMYGEAWDEFGNRIAARQVTPEGYQLTALTSLAIVQKLLDGHPKFNGFNTPAQVFGPDLIMEIDGVTRENVA